MNIETTKVRRIQEDRRWITWAQDEGLHRQSCSFEKGQMTLSSCPLLIVVEEWGKYWNICQQFSLWVVLSTVSFLASQDLSSGCLIQKAKKSSLWGLRWAVQRPLSGLTNICGFSLVFLNSVPMSKTELFIRGKFLVISCICVYMIVTSPCK
jgi:hypothetical protein